MSFCCHFIFILWITYSQSFPAGFPLTQAPTISKGIHARAIDAYQIASCSSRSYVWLAVAWCNAGLALKGEGCCFWQQPSEDAREQKHILPHGLHMISKTAQLISVCRRMGIQRRLHLRVVISWLVSKTQNHHTRTPGFRCCPIIHPTFSPG